MCCRFFIGCCCLGLCCYWWLGFWLVWVGCIVWLDVLWFSVGLFGYWLGVCRWCYCWICVGGCFLG